MNDILMPLLKIALVIFMAGNLLGNGYNGYKVSIQPPL